MSDDRERDSADLPPVAPEAPRQPRYGIRRRTATIATVGGLTAGAVVGGMVISQAATSTSTSSSPAAAGTPSSPSATPSSGSSSTSNGSNEDPAHEKNESPQREAQENSGNVHPGGGPGGCHGGLQGEDQTLVAGALGISATQLQTELGGGKTIAAIAKEHNVDVNTVISTWVASENKEIDDRVASGALTKAQGDQAKTQTQQRVTDEVNGTHTSRMR